MEQGQFASLYYRRREETTRVPLRQCGPPNRGNFAAQHTGFNKTFLRISVWKDVTVTRRRPEGRETGRKEKKGNKKVCSRAHLGGADLASLHGPPM